MTLDGARARAAVRTSRRRADLSDTESAVIERIGAVLDAMPAAERRQRTREWANLPRGELQHIIDRYAGDLGPFTLGPDGRVEGKAE